MTSLLRSLRVAIGIVFGCCSHSCASLHAADARRPNVLWICADDHAAYVCGAYGNNVVRTPNLDGLAASGMRFDRAFCNSPVCTASRQSFLTGRNPLELYNIVRDPSEIHNVAAEHPEAVAKIEEYLKSARVESPDFPVRGAK